MFMIRECFAHIMAYAVGLLYLDMMWLVPLCHHMWDASLITR